MIIDPSKSTLETYGDIKEYKTSIDPKNLDFITTLLSSNLYSHPEESFIREIVSNAWDAHVEAGTTDTPIIISISNTSNNVIIRDYGTGISPDRFKEIYCNIGSSTKRESNNFIGGFGIGKFSSLACSNTVYITSYYNGVEYSYVMIKDGNTITTNLLFEKCTEENNGVKIEIKNVNKTKIENIKIALNHIVFFPNVYVEEDNVRSIFNDIKIRNFESFAVATTPIVRDCLLLGKVLYPYDREILPLEERIFFSPSRSMGIALKFDIGELEVTPNRENIIYNNRSVEKIRDRAIKARKEMSKIFVDKVSKNYKNIYEYVTAYKTTPYNFITETLDSEVCPYHVFLEKDIPKNSILYNNLDLSDLLPIIRSICEVTIPNIRAVIYRDNICTKNVTKGYKYYTSTRLCYDKVVVVPKSIRLTASIRGFLKENYSNYTVIEEFDLREFTSYINTLLPNIIEKLGTQRDFIIRSIYLDTICNYVREDFKSPRYKEYTEKNAKEKITDAAFANITLHRFNKYSWNDTYSKIPFKTFQDAITFIKSIRTGVIVLDTKEYKGSIEPLCKFGRFEVIRARKEVAEKIKSKNLTNVMTKQHLEQRGALSRKLNMIHTVLAHFDRRNFLYEMGTIIKYIPDQLSKELGKLVSCVTNVPIDIELYAKEVGKIDPYAEYLCKVAASYIEKYKEIRAITSWCALGSDADIIAAVILKTKAFRLGYTPYLAMKRNKILKILC